MSRETLEAVVRWQNREGQPGPLEITFHGGEPLVPGVEFYRVVLPLLREGLSRREVRIGVQSNLWLLTAELCGLFREYDVAIGTSLDGPEAINDAQRGRGYFRRTMAGLRLARARGLSVGCICTFTPQSAPHVQEIYDFFAREGLDWSIHAALPAPAHPHHAWVLPPEAHGELLVTMLDLYVADGHKVRISTLDALCRSLSARRGALCTFQDCLGEYLAVDPEGWIYPCQRFAGMAPFRLGRVNDCPSLDLLSASPVWRAFQDRQKRVDAECGECPHLDLCRGGCPYNVLAANGGSFGRTWRDPHCPAYKRIFAYIADRALQEVFSGENLAPVVADGSSQHGLLRKGKLLQVMLGDTHPRHVAARARRVAAAVALAVSRSSDEAVDRLDRAGLVAHRDLARQSVAALQSQLRDQPQGLVNAYLHVTLACNLACSHCYVSAGPQENGPTMPVKDVIRLVRQAAAAGFRRAVITGGEPLAHPRREALFDALAALRQTIKPMQFVLRTNLTSSLAPTGFEKLAQSADQIVVSVDGDRASHDARRGAGAYARTVANLHTLLRFLPSAGDGDGRTGVVLAATLTPAQVSGPEGEAVRRLGEELGVPVRFKPILPLGRATGMPLAPEVHSSPEDGCEAQVDPMRPRATCGLGMNLYIGPGGECYPCYALAKPTHTLGNALDEGLATVLRRNDTYRKVTVDTNVQCRGCALRYLCGGFCRAWSNGADPNDAPRDCVASHERARRGLANALEVLRVSLDRWRAAGLPLPDGAHVAA